MKMKGPFLPSKQLLVFNGAYVLIAVVRSLHSAADFSGINLQSISFSCTGILYLLLKKKQGGGYK